jgi:hypothetical protein
MIWILAKSCNSDTGIQRKRDNLLTGGGEGEGLGEEQNHTTARKPGPLSKSFNTLCQGRYKRIFPFPLFLLSFFSVCVVVFFIIFPLSSQGLNPPWGGGGLFFPIFTSVNTYQSIPLACSSVNSWRKYLFKTKDHLDFILPVPYCFEGSTGTVPYRYHSVLLK